MGFFKKLSVPSADLSGKVVIVTGSNTGIGYETAKWLAANKAFVILACRNKEKGEAAVQAIKVKNPSALVEYQSLDLSSFDSVQLFAKEFKKTKRNLDVLINNAGLISPQFSKTKDGFETTYQVNHLGHFLLTNLLLDTLVPGSRVIHVSSNAAFYAKKLNFDDLNNEKSYHSWKQYANSKLMNVLFSNELAKRLADRKIQSHALHPGFVKTEFGRDFARGFLAIFGALQFLFARDSLEGAMTTIHAAISKEAGELNGCFFSNCAKVPGPQLASSSEDCARFWEISERDVALSQRLSDLNK